MFDVAKLNKYFNIPNILRKKIKKIFYQLLFCRLKIIS